jgi:hypothetical protein
MEGMARAASRQVDFGIATAWHTAIFALSGYAGKLRDKKLSDYLTSTNEAERAPADDQRMQNARGIHFFRSLKERGVPVDIERVVH